MSDQIKISGPKAISLASPIAPLDSDHLRLLDAIIRFQDRQQEPPISLQEGTSTAVSSLDSLKTQASAPRSKRSGGLKIRRDPEQDPKIVRPFVPRTKSTDDES
jgi:hypothetical protein